MKFKSPVSRTAVRSWLVRLATENLGLKLMSLCLSIATWAWLQSEQVVERRARARGSWASSPRGHGSPERGSPPGWAS